MKKYANVGNDGTGVVENLYTKIGTGNPQDYLFADFSNAHQPLKVYTKSNELVTGKRVEVTDGWRYNSPDTAWTICEGHTALFKKQCGYDVEQIYLATEVEKDLPLHLVTDYEMCKGGKCICKHPDECAFTKIDNKFTKPVSQPVKEVSKVRILANKEIENFAIERFNEAYRTWCHDPMLAYVHGLDEGTEKHAQFTNSNMVEEWISVKDVLPDYGKNILTFNQFVRMGYLGSRGFKDAISNAIIKGVTHWQPLPSPPKSETFK